MEYGNIFNGETIISNLVTKIGTFNCESITSNPKKKTQYLLNRNLLHFTLMKKKNQEGKES